MKSKTQQLWNFTLHKTHWRYIWQNSIFRLLSACHGITNFSSFADTIVKQRTWHLRFSTSIWTHDMTPTWQTTNVKSSSTIYHIVCCFGTIFQSLKQSTCLKFVLHQLKSNCQAGIHHTFIPAIAASSSDTKQKINHSTRSRGRDNVACRNVKAFPIFPPINYTRFIGRGWAMPRQAAIRRRTVPPSHQASVPTVPTDRQSGWKARKKAMISTMPPSVCAEAALSIGVDGALREWRYQSPCVYVYVCMNAASY